jgi:hypothetical protein
VPKTTRKARHRSKGAKAASGALRRRVTQESIDQMAELRRQGLPFEEIGARLGCSERTARRYAGRVQPQLHIPEANPEPDVEDPRRMRERLARWCSDQLYNMPGDPKPRDSVTFLAEAARLVQERLAGLDVLTLELMLRDIELRKHFMREVVGYLWGDFSSHVRFDTGFGIDSSVSAAEWRPLRERTHDVAEDFEDDEPDDDL